jgi:hypothetical protein
MDALPPEHAPAVELVLLQHKLHTHRRQTAHGAVGAQ